MRDADDLIIPVLIAAVGAIPVAATLEAGERFGAAGTLGLGALVLGVVGVVAECFRAHLPPARAVPSREVGSLQRDRPRTDSSE